ncbi:NAD(P)H-dependent oxidoreductase [Aurantimonas sp. VKM B-3413]|uniref:NAD(P)H-dependent oxidoreductase n=1 Tax=Aurantimonas sp. VKM B-3413 TaxID=2779401 RepID=UPI001E310EF0|nr:NAD(P)H-dependent oxidoreductase [Aurantimonas sp. VKM B-3413]MCB8839878.1 NAD(P)H-dependent oxidoreductase [Aurantimonas sp. VKM B-3413]
MPRRILLILGHPDPAPNHLCRALADAYDEGARAEGHTVDRIDLSGLDFPLLRSPADFMSGSVPDALRPAADALAAADHVVIVFPLWLGTMPAVLKAFLEQLMRPGVAFENAAGGKGFPKGRLSGRSARVVVTMGMPSVVYRLWFRNHGIACLRRNILNFVGIRPVRETLYGMVEAGEPTKREGWIAQMRALGARAG